MDFSQIPLFGVMKTKLDYLSQRQAVLAQNIANADTPGYKAMDVAAPDFKKMLNAATPARALQMQITDPRHRAHGAIAAGEFKIDKRAATDELNPDGNNVVIEEEMSKVAENQMEYQKALSLYGK